jgi:hypothetical protein
MKYSWGDVIQVVRNFHIEFYDRFPSEHPLHLNLASALGNLNSFQFPQSIDDSSYYRPQPLPSAIEDWIEFHPVERFLLEGPLAPTETIDLQQEAQVHLLFKQILTLEKAWLVAVSQDNLHYPLQEAQQIMEQAFKRMIKQFYPKPRLRVI